MILHVEKKINKRLKFNLSLTKRNAAVKIMLASVKNAQISGFNNYKMPPYLTCNAKSSERILKHIALKKVLQSV